ncbi:Hypp5678 [Branchiostoma lanceolatum]|uniref:Hypp5678 protein n=1 Tax=Branchiostoma lanceolatum TaxID=7740 RepID=A0A8J9VR74_BRALA|nr:Hypp5678 [Branchiostoma lanceolatum]
MRGGKVRLATSKWGPLGNANGSGNIPNPEHATTSAWDGGRVGSDNTNREKHMGRHGLGSITDNGERLIDTCEEFDLAIGGTLFEHKNIHKLTWIPPDGKTESQIDHGMINNKWKRSLQDTKK